MICGNFMNTIRALIFVSAFIVADPSQANQPDIQLVKDLCANIEVTEDLFLEPRTTDDAPKRLISLAKDHWKHLLDSFQNGITDPRHQTRVVLAISVMNGEDYLQAVAYGLRLFCDGKVSISVVHKLLMPPMNRYGFLAVNRNHPLVRELLPELRRKMPSEDEYTTFVEKLIDGRAEKQAVEYWQGNNLPSIKPLSIVVSSPVHTSLTQLNSYWHEPSRPPEESIPPNLIKSKEVSSTTFWTVVAILLLATTGLLWLLLKRRS